MTSKKASSVGDSNKEVGETKQGRGKERSRHKFTKHDVEILNRLFEERWYPEFWIRKELANQMHCHIYIINNWFQNKRSRLRPREKQKNRENESPVQSDCALGHQDAQRTSDIGTNAQPYCPQQGLLGRAGYFSMETWGGPIEEDGSCDSVIPGMRKEPSCAPPSFNPGMYNHPASSLQPFERATFTTEESQQSGALPLPHVDSMQGKMQQQEDQELSGQYWLYEGQRQVDWRYSITQMQQPQNYQEKLPFQDSFLISQKHGDLGKQMPSFLQHEDGSFQRNGEALSSEMQVTSLPQMEASILPVPLGQDGTQHAAEEPSSSSHHLWDEESEEVYDLDKIITGEYRVQF